MSNIKFNHKILVLTKKVACPAKCGKSKHIMCKIMFFAPLGIQSLTVKLLSFRLKKVENV